MDDIGLQLDRLSASSAGGDAGRLGVADVLRQIREIMTAREVDLWLNAISLAHEPTHRHCLLTGCITVALATAMGLGQDDRRRLVRGALLHDVGKIHTPTTILDKPGALAPTEVAILKRHAQAGFKLLQEQGGHDPATLAIVRHHHELLDGSGYPCGLRGDEIGRDLRIVTVCDIFSALVEDRSYRPGHAPVQAFEMMTEMRGKLDRTVFQYLPRLFAISL